MIHWAKAARPRTPEHIQYTVENSLFDRFQLKGLLCSIEQSIGGGKQTIESSANGRLKLGTTVPMIAKTSSINRYFMLLKEAPVFPRTEAEPNEEHQDSAVCRPCA